MFIVRIIWEGTLVERHRFPCEATAMRFYDDRSDYMAEGEAIQLIDGERILAEYFAA